MSDITIAQQLAIQAVRTAAGELWSRVSHHDVKWDDASAAYHEMTKAITSDVEGDPRAEALKALSMSYAACCEAMMHDRRGLPDRATVNIDRAADLLAQAVWWSIIGIVGDVEILPMSAFMTKDELATRGA